MKKTDQLYIHFLCIFFEEWIFNAHASQSPNVFRDTASRLGINRWRTKDSTHHWHDHTNCKCVTPIGNHLLSLSIDQLTEFQPSNYSFDILERNVHIHHFLSFFVLFHVTIGKERTRHRIEGLIMIVFERRRKKGTTGRNDRWEYLLFSICSRNKYYFYVLEYRSKESTQSFKTFLHQSLNMKKKKKNNNYHNQLTYVWSSVIGEYLHKNEQCHVQHSIDYWRDKEKSENGEEACFIHSLWLSSFPGKYIWFFSHLNKTYSLLQANTSSSPIVFRSDA